jgi:uncharacterized membrane protein YkvA (DUF1232 family)
MWERLKRWAQQLRDDTLTLYFCARHPDTPMVARGLALAIAAYALSPIDLIPDFIPVLGYVDELLLLPAAIYLCLKLTPSHVVRESRDKATAWVAARQSGPVSYAGSAVVIAVWALTLWLLWRLASGTIYQRQ